MTFAKPTQTNVALLLSLFILSTIAHADGPYQATGIRIGDVTHNWAFVWTRLTTTPDRVGMDAPLPQVTYEDPKTGETHPEPESGKPDWNPIVTFPDGSTIDTIQGACPASPGEVRVRYRKEGEENWGGEGWKTVKLKHDATWHFILTRLSPATRYELLVETRPPGGEVSSTVEGGFTTAPAADDAKRVAFTVTTGQRYTQMDVEGGGFRLYNAMLKDRPDFFVHTGDIMYYDELAKTEALARWHWQRTYSLATNRDFHRQVASYFIKDDHDTWRNDCWPTMGGIYMGDFTFAQGQAIFREQVPMDEKTYRTVRWGKDLQIWLVEGRDFRSPNDMKDGPDKTIWGAEQKAWFKQTVKESDATFRVLISPTPIVGPDRARKNDNHANVGFTHEGDELRKFIADQKNMYIVCGDRHWQYVTVDDETGVREFSCGPATDEHAGGWNPKDRTKEHQYLNVIGGYLGVVVDRIDETPTATFTHYSVDGAPLHEEKHGAL